MEFISTPHRFPKHDKKIMEKTKEDAYFLFIGTTHSTIKNYINENIFKEKNGNNDGERPYIYCK